MELVATLLSRVLLEGLLPKCCSSANLVSRPKKEAPEVPTDYPGISITFGLYRILMAIIRQRLVDRLDAKLRPEQLGFRPGRSTTDAIFALVDVTKRKTEVNESTDAIFIDFKAAYDTVHPSALRFAMKRLGLPTGICARLTAVT